MVEPAFGEGEMELKDGFVEADLGRGLSVRAGQFKVPFGFESLRSSTDLRFAERAFPTSLSPRRDVGVEITGEWTAIEAQAGLFNGVPDGSSAGDGRSLDAAARVFVRPPGTGLGLGLAATAGTERGDDSRRALSDAETPGDRLFFDYEAGVVADGPRLRLGPQATLDAGRFHLLGEVTWARHRISGRGGRIDLTHRAWQAAASVVLVGEPRGALRPVPRLGVWDGGPGAVEVSTRLHGLSLDPTSERVAAPGSARHAAAAAVALHWSPVAEARLGVTAERTVLSGFDGGRPETLVVLRAQIDV